MSRIEGVFASKDGAAFIPYVTAGYPSMGATIKAVTTLAECGADMVEIGIPFSDPLADGITVQRASFHALRAGVTPDLCLKAVRLLRQEVELPLILMSYFNPLLSYGIEKFCAEAARAGADGLIVPDLPLEEAGELEKAALGCGLDTIYLLAPTSTKERIRRVARHSRGFIYLVSVTGVTGVRESLPPDLPELVARVRALAGQPLCVGFGISTPEQAAQVSRIADGVIVGSRLVEIMGEGGDWPSKLAVFARRVKGAISAAKKI